jgi:hypothetical protein
MRRKTNGIGQTGNTAGAKIPFCPARPLRIPANVITHFGGS